MTKKEITDIFENLEDNDLNHLIYAFIRWWTYGKRFNSHLKIDNQLVSVDTVNWGVAIVRKIPVLNSENFRLDVKIYPKCLFIKTYIFTNKEFIKSFYPCNNTDEILSKLENYGIELTYPEFFENKEELLNG